MNRILHLLKIRRSLFKKIDRTDMQAEWTSFFFFSTGFNAIPKRESHCVLSRVVLNSMLLHVSSQYDISLYLI
jgi:hypothetical protein